MRPIDRQFNELVSFLTIVFGIFMMGVVIALLVRLQRGLLGVILSGIAIGILVFWLIEIRRSLLNQPQGFGPFFGKKILGRMLVDEPYTEDESWAYDLLESDGETVLVTKVPGPEGDIKVNLLGRRLKITAGQGFSKVLTMPNKIGVNKVIYKNGVLQIRFTKRDSEIRRLPRTQ